MRYQKEAHPAQRHAQDAGGGRHENTDGEQIIEAGPSLYPVPSRSTDGHREARHDKGMWTCGCPYFASGHANCSHTCAVRMMLKMREESGCAIRPNMRVEAPETACPKCGKREFHVSTTYPTRFGETAVYKCDNPECGARFTFGPGFKKKWFSDAVITDVLVDAGSDHPPGRILERMEKNGVDVSDRTIRRWIKEYGEIIEWFTATLPYGAGGEWATDEIHLKTHPEGSKSDHYLAAILDNTTDLILSYEVTDNKPKYDATGLVNAAMGRTSRVPGLFIADRLSGYKKWFVNAIQSRNPSAIMIADAAINGVHLNNNKRERLNGELWDCLYRTRGFGSLIPGLVRLSITYHNFIHRGSRKDTPAEAAGVVVAGPDRLRTLIPNAALMTA